MSEMQVSILPRRGGAGGIPKSAAPGLASKLANLSTHKTARDDPRYRTRRWKRVRLRVLNRDGWACRIVTGCPSRATVADHIIPAFLGMADDLFFGVANLRAGCRPHNLARGFAASAEATPGADSTLVTGDYS